MFNLKKKNPESVKEEIFEDTKEIIQSRDHNQKREVKKQMKELLDATQQFHIKRIEIAEKSERRAWKVAFAGVAVGVAGVIAVACIAPLKTVVPYLMRFNSDTGYTDIAPIYQNNKQSQGEIVDKYFLSRYVIYHEGYDWQTIQSYSDNVALMSSDHVFMSYDTALRGDNSPLKVLGENKRMKIDVIGVTFLGDVAQIRYRKTVLAGNGEPDVNFQPMNYLATVNYDYQKKIRFDKERINVNPLGFQVLSWNTSPENVASTSR